MRKFLKKLFKDISGNVLLISGAGTVTLVGGAGLGVDTVQWYLWKRQLQQAVDSGALAGGNAKAQGSAWQTYATQELNRNANTALNIVRIVNPPQQGAFTGDTGAIEVVATTQQTLPFSSLFISVAPTLTARAVATSVVDGEHCVISLAGSGVGVSTVGNADVLLGCGVAANSGDYTAIDLDGTSYLEGTPLTAKGGIQYGAGNIAAGTTVQSYTVAQNDPLASLYSMSDVPNMPCTDNSGITVNPNQTLNLGPLTTGPNRGYRKICNGLTVRGTLNLSSGVYIINKGDFTANSQAEITGHGVTFILTGTNASNVSAVDLAGGAEIDLRAPNSDDDPSFIASEWYGMLFFQNPIADYPLSKINGGSDLKLEGITYMPSGEIRFNGNAGQHADCLLLVSYRVEFGGESSLDNNCPTDIQNIDLGARIVRVVE